MIVVTFIIIVVVVIDLVLALVLRSDPALPALLTWSPRSPCLPRWASTFGIAATIYVKIIVTIVPAVEATPSAGRLPNPERERQRDSFSRRRTRRATVGR